METKIQIHLIHTLEKIVSHFAMQDMLKAQGKTKSRRIKPYCLSDETIEASDYLKQAHAGENEEGIKGYILGMRMRTDTKDIF